MIYLDPHVCQDYADLDKLHLETIQREEYIEVLQFFDLISF